MILSNWGKIVQNQETQSGEEIMKTNRNLKVNRLLRKSGHLVIEAEAVFPHRLSGKNKVTLSLLSSVHN